jgi:hypothetical protein
MEVDALLPQPADLPRLSGVRISPPVLLFTLVSRVDGGSFESRRSHSSELNLNDALKEVDGYRRKHGAAAYERAWSANRVVAGRSVGELAMKSFSSDECRRRLSRTTC